MAFGTLKFDTLTTSDTVDTSTERSINTSYLLNGVAKCWCATEGDLITANIQDSFNSTTVTDGGTGFITINYTNNMSAGTYTPHCTGINGDHLINGAGDVLTSSCKFGHYNQANSVIDTPYGSYSMLGHLA